MCRFRPRLQRRDRAGFAPASLLYPIWAPECLLDTTYMTRMQSVKKKSALRKRLSQEFFIVSFNGAGVRIAPRAKPLPFPHGAVKKIDGADDQGPGQQKIRPTHLSLPIPAGSPPGRWRKTPPRPGPCHKQRPHRTTSRCRTRGGRPRPPPCRACRAAQRP